MVWKIGDGHGSTLHAFLGGGLRHVLFLPRKLGIHDPIWGAYFSIGLVNQPLTKFPLQGWGKSIFPLTPPDGMLENPIIDIWERCLFSVVVSNIFLMFAPTWVENHGRVTCFLSKSCFVCQGTPSIILKISQNHLQHHCQEIRITDLKNLLALLTRLEAVETQGFCVWPPLLSERSIERTHVCLKMHRCITGARTPSEHRTMVFFHHFLHPIVN